MPEEVMEANTLAVISAINNTYGAKINPEVVPEFFRLLEKLKIELSGYEGTKNWYILNEVKAAIEKATIK
jgi:hypothetical protein